MIDKVIQTARTYAANRLAEKVGFNRRAKLGVAEIDKELQYAAVFGELSCLERIIAVLVSDPNMTREDLEAQLHLSVIEYHDYLRRHVGSSKTRISLDRYLELRGYTGKGAMSQTTSVGVGG